MRLLHYSDKHLDKIDSRSQVDGRADGSKPHGLWVSVEGEDDWKAWCEGEDFRRDFLSHATEIVLAPTANILHIDTVAGLVRFHREYKCRPSFASDGPLATDAYWDNHAVRWGDVAARYDGIIIAPYQSSLRLDGECRWYYGWDCASGCIWNAGAVVELKPVM